MEVLDLEVYNLAGRQLNVVRPGTTGIDVSQLPSGIYFLHSLDLATHYADSKKILKVPILLLMPLFPSFRLSS